MSEAAAQTALLWMIATVFVANLLLGFLQSTPRKATFALIQATAFTTVAMFALVRPDDPPDGQTGMAIPILWLPFFGLSWLGLLIAGWIRERR